MSNKILTNVISVAFTEGHITLSLKEAIEAFQIKLNNKRKYLAFYIRKSIHNCYDAMTTSPCESMNKHIKHTSKATTLNNTRWVKRCLYEVLHTILLVLFRIYYSIYNIPFMNSSIFVLCLVVHCYWLQMVQMIAYLQLTTLLHESYNCQLSIQNSHARIYLFGNVCICCMTSLMEGRNKNVYVLSCW
jgi:hypothetical protein